MDRRTPVAARRVLVAALTAASLTACAASAGSDSLPEVADKSAAPTAKCTVSAKLVPSCGAWWGVTPAIGTRQDPRDVVREYERQAGRTVDLVHTYESTMLIAGLWSGLAGGLFVTLSPLATYMHFNWTVDSFLVIVIGGLGSMVGALLGGLLFGVLSFGASFYAPTIAPAITFGVLLMFLMSLFIVTGDRPLPLGVQSVKRQRCCDCREGNDPDDHRFFPACRRFLDRGPDSPDRFFHPVHFRLPPIAFSQAFSASCSLTCASR